MRWDKSDVLKVDEGTQSSPSVIRGEHSNYLPQWELELAS